MAKHSGPYLYVTLLVNEQVLWLEISVDEIQRVKVFKGQDNLRGVKAGVWFTRKQMMHVVKQRLMETLPNLVQVSLPESPDSPQV